jgi:hypothetical protein
MNVFLHVGYSKTGTTAIQKYLSVHRGDLSRKNIIYPDVKINGSWLNALNHTMFARALADRKGWYKQSADVYVEQFIRQAKETNAELLVISSESFLGAINPWEFDNEERYWAAFHKYVTRLYSQFKEFKINIIVYLRSQDDWLESAINQTIKFGGLMPEKVRVASIEELIEIYRPRLDYEKVLNIYAGVFGKDAVKVRLYEKSKLVDGDVVSDFLDILGIKIKEVTEGKVSSTITNKKLSRDILEFKQILNRVQRPKYQERVITEYLQMISNDIKSQEKGSFFSEEQIKTIFDEYKKGNRYIMEEYLGLQGENIFTNIECEKNNNYQYKGLSTEKALEYHLLLDRYMHSIEGRKQLFRHWLAEVLRHKAPKLHALFRSFYFLFKSRF